MPSEVHGVGYIKSKDGVYKLISKDGKIVANSQDGEFDEILACGDGFALVYKYSGPKDSKHLYGVLDNKGQFICSFIDLGTTYTFSKYRGCGIFSISYIGGTALLNLNKEKVIHLSNDAPEFINNTAYIPDGYYITETKQDGNYVGMETLPACIIDTDFNITNRKDITSSYKYPYSYSSNGLIIAYNAGYGNTIAIINPKTNDKYTLDYNTTQLISLDYVGNLGLLKIKASDGNTYFTLLDTQGKEQFDPIKYNQTVKFSDEKIIYQNDKKYTILNTTGKVLVENLEYKTISEFSEDIAVAITTYDEYCFINSKGEKILRNIHE